MKRILIVLCLAVMVAGIACAPGQYQVKDNIPATVCYPSNRDCRSSWPAIEVPGTGHKMPPAGAWCKDLGDNILDCGKKYSHIRLLTPPV